MKGMETVTVDKAIEKGHKMLRPAIIALLLVPLTLSIILVVSKVLSFYYLVLSVPVGFVLSWFYWSFMVTKWKLWAFENVKNVHELKRRAIQEGIIWPDSSSFSKTEISSKAEKEKWQLLQLKFLENDVFNDDPTVPFQTEIYRLKKSRIHSRLKFHQQSTNDLPQIILNKEGIKTAKTDFIPWSVVKDELIIMDESGRDLTFEYYEKMATFNIDDLDIQWKELKRLLTIYRSRYENKTPHLSR